MSGTRFEEPPAPSEPSSGTKRQGEGFFARINRRCLRVTKWHAQAIHEATTTAFRRDEAEEKLRVQEEPESNDDNDPRNWTAMHKNTTYITICLFSFIANVNASAFTVATKTLIGAFHITLTEATSLTALNVLTFGLGNILWVPLMRIVGKRPVYLMAIAVVIVSNAWSATAATYGSLLASRIISGLGASAADATVPSAIGDLWTQRTRAHRAMIFHFFLASGVFLGPLINAWVIQLHGWRWVPGWISIVSGFIFVLAIFFIHETEYRQERVKHAVKPIRLTFMQWLNPTLGFQRINPGRRFAESLRDIFQMTTYPQILYSGILTGVFVGWTIIMQISLSQTLSSPPYRWPLGHVGFLHFAGWIGVLFALPTAGYGLDRYMEHRRTTPLGKPKHRLPFLIGPFVIAPTGLLIFGIMLGHKHGWLGPAFGYGMHSFGFAAVSNILVSYLLEINTIFAGEGLVCLFVIRNAIAVACTYGAGAGGWISGKGNWDNAFGAMAGIEWGLILLAVIFYLFSANLEGCTAKYGPGVRAQIIKRAAQRGRGVREVGGDEVEMQNSNAATEEPGEAGAGHRLRESGRQGEEPPVASGALPPENEGLVNVDLDDDVEAGRHARR